MSLLPAAQAGAYLLASYGLWMELEEVFREIQGAAAAASVIALLAEEARAAAHLVHDQAAAQIARELGRRTFAEFEWEPSSAPRPRSQPQRAARPPRPIAGVLLSCKATLVGISAGYSGTYAQGHPLNVALRDAAAALDALRAELGRLQPLERSAPLVARARRAPLEMDGDPGTRY